MQIPAPAIKATNARNGEQDIVTRRRLKLSRLIRHIPHRSQIWKSALGGMFTCAHCGSHRSEPVLTLRAQRECSGAGLASDEFWLSGHGSAANVNRLCP